MTKVEVYPLKERVSALSPLSSSSEVDFLKILLTYVPPALAVIAFAALAYTVRDLLRTRRK